MNALQHVDKALALLRGQIAQELHARLIGEPPDFIEDGARLVLDVKAPRAAVIERLGAAMTPTQG